MANFIVNDETKKNSHGFYLLNAGGRFDRFTENPVMLYNHDLKELIGKWDNLHTEDRCLIAEPDFDEVDEYALKIKGKVDRGYLRGASPGIIILAAEWRENPVTHEMEIYVTEWELFEVSVVSVPSNAGALTLKVYDSNHAFVSDDKIQCHVENIIRLSIDNQSTNLKVKEMDIIKLTAEAFVALGLNEGADASALSSAIVSLKKKADDSAAELDKYKKEAEEQKKKEAEDIVELAIKEGRIDATQKEDFISLALSNPKVAKTTLAAIPAKKSLSAMVKQTLGVSAIPSGRENWTLLQWMKEDMPGLKKLQNEDPETYNKIKNQ